MYGGKRKIALARLAQEFVDVYNTHGCVEILNLSGGRVIALNSPPTRDQEKKKTLINKEEE